MAVKWVSNNINKGKRIIDSLFFLGCFFSFFLWRRIFERRHRWGETSWIPGSIRNTRARRISGANDIVHRVIIVASGDSSCSCNKFSFSIIKILVMSKIKKSCFLHGVIRVRVGIIFVTFVVLWNQSIIAILLLSIVYLAFLLFLSFSFFCFFVFLCFFCFFVFFLFSNVVFILHRLTWWCWWWCWWSDGYWRLRQTGWTSNGVIRCMFWRVCCGVPAHIRENQKSTPAIYTPMDIQTNFLGFLFQVESVLEPNGFVVITPF